jgi:hypothetical protein
VLAEQHLGLLVHGMEKKPAELKRTRGDKRLTGQDREEVVS